jgi:hypothetical protein
MLARRDAKAKKEYSDDETTKKKMKDVITSLDQTIDHGIVAVGFFEFGRHDPDLSIGGNVFTSLV